MERNVIDYKGEDYSNEVYDGDFDCSYNNLTTLEGAPKVVNRYFFVKIIH